MTIAEHGFCRGCGRPLRVAGGSLRPRNADLEDWPAGDGWTYVQDDEHARTWNRTLVCDSYGCAGTWIISVKSTITLRGSDVLPFALTPKSASGESHP